jgi:hypothetical protein
VHEGISLFVNHPKFSIEIPLNSTKRPSKNPNSIQAEGQEYESSGTNRTSGQSFIIQPENRSHPIGQEASKRADAVNFIIDEVSK